MQYRSKGSKGSKNQKQHDIAEPVRAGYFSYAHEIVSAGERAESAPGGCVGSKASRSREDLRGNTMTETKYKQANSRRDLDGCDGCDLDGQSRLFS